MSNVIRHDFAARFASAAPVATMERVCGMHGELPEVGTNLEGVWGAGLPTTSGVVIGYKDFSGAMHCVVVDENGRTDYADRFRTPADLSPIGWHVLGDKEPLNSAEVAVLAALALDVEATKAKQEDAKEQERAEALARGREVLKRLPAGCKALIVAQLRQDASDSMSDYYGSKTVRTVILAASTHTRSNFAEMRKAAARFPATAHMATESDENREMYSMGGGMYLSEKDGHRHSGWIIRKDVMYHDQWSNDTVRDMGRPNGLGV